MTDETTDRLPDEDDSAYVQRMRARTARIVAESEEYLKRKMSPTEAHILSYSDSRNSYFLKSQFGIESDEGCDVIHTGDGPKPLSQIGKLINIVFTPVAGESENFPKTQVKVYLGKLKKEVTVDSLRCLASLHTWAHRMQMVVGFEEDRRVYLTSSFFSRDDANQLPWGWITMTMDALHFGGFVPSDRL